MRILAVDFGRKRLGLALSRSGSLVVPLAPLTLTTTDDLLSYLRELITHEQIEQLIVGDGISQPGTRNWLDALQKNLAIPVILVDERSSTNEAQRRLGTTQHHADSTAAAIILERYIEDLLQ